MSENDEVALEPVLEGVVLSTPSEQAQLRVLASEYGPAAIRELAMLGGLLDGNGRMVKNIKTARFGQAKSEHVKVQCLGMLLDRGYGKVSQPIQHSADEGLEALLDRIGKDPE